MANDLISRSALLESIEGIDWYSIHYDGKIDEGAPSEEAAWYKATDIYSALENAPVVTVRASDGCDYCEEDSEGYRKANGAFYISNPFRAGEWFLNTGHCKPRQIYFCPMCGRELPKGE